MHAGAGGGRRTEYLPGRVRGFPEKTSSVCCHHEADRSVTDRKVPAGRRLKDTGAADETHLCSEGTQRGSSQPSHCEG